MRKERKKRVPSNVPLPPKKNKETVEDMIPEKVEQVVADTSVKEKKDNPNPLKFAFIPISRNIEDAHERFYDFLKENLDRNIDLKTVLVAIPNRFMYVTFIIRPRDGFINPVYRDFTPVISVCDADTDPDFIIEQAVLNLEQAFMYGSEPVELFEKWVQYSDKYPV